MVAKLSLIHWHIEVSSICSLKCPRCPRAEVPVGDLNKQLTLDFFKNQIGAERVKEIKKITFCGDDGDPIYAKEFLDICAWLKEVHPEIMLVIITNGSYRSKNWWVALSATLNEYDEIQWSLDGWDQESNEQYRVNCNWESIMLGIKTFTAFNNETYTTVATIAFSFNQDSLHKIQEIVDEYSIDLWQMTRSTKFGRVYPEVYGLHDPLEPAPEWVADGHRFDRKLYYATYRFRPSDLLHSRYLQKRDEILEADEYPALCYVGTKGIYLKANGELYPCCWVANRYEHNKEMIEVAQSRFNLNNRTLDEILEDEWWTTEFTKFKNMECQAKCTKKNFTDEFVTEW